MCSGDRQWKAGMEAVLLINATAQGETRDGDCVTRESRAAAVYETTRAQAVGVRAACSAAGPRVTMRASTPDPGSDATDQLFRLIVGRSVDQASDKSIFSS